ncbi:hypothetical protein K227x_60570 [Rubripirellula lacrimiformis]|uniref:Uncharacterized protein n=1 Tax=Rubripirellula lacrimiformis TaxID=1930273 RepID=A0A517NKM6_9BACT|nr:hypothetical protein K227x_60570 [Rubripirellula lacrimiformis]
MEPGERGLKKAAARGADVGRIKERSDADPAPTHPQASSPDPQPLSPNSIQVELGWNRGRGG